MTHLRCCAVLQRPSAPSDVHHVFFLATSPYYGLPEVAASVLLRDTPASVGGCSCVVPPPPPPRTTTSKLLFSASVVHAVALPTPTPPPPTIVYSLACAPSVPPGSFLQALDRLAVGGVECLPADVDPLLCAQAASKLASDIRCDAAPAPHPASWSADRM